MNKLSGYSGVLVATLPNFGLLTEHTTSADLIVENPSKVRQYSVYIYIYIYTCVVRSCRIHVRIFRMPSHVFEVVEALFLKGIYVVYLHSKAHSRSNYLKNRCCVQSKAGIHHVDTQPKGANILVPGVIWEKINISGKAKTAWIWYRDFGSGQNTNLIEPHVHLQYGCNAENNIFVGTHFRNSFGLKIATHPDPSRASAVRPVCRATSAALRSPKWRTNLTKPWEIMEPTTGPSHTKMRPK